MKSETAWEKVPCRLFFCVCKEKSVQQTNGWMIRLKKCSHEPNLCYSVDEANR